MDKFIIIEERQQHSKASPWGNSFIEITEEDIAALRNGKVLYHYDGEYGTFVTMSEEV